MPDPQDYEAWKRIADAADQRRRQRLVNLQAKKISHKDRNGHKKT
jgi:hypothetical protein